MEEVETDDPVLELEKLRRMKMFNNLRIKFIINIHKRIKKYQEVKVYWIFVKTRGSELRMDSRKY